MSALSSAKHKVETSDMGEIRPQTKDCAEPKWKLRGHMGFGAPTWKCTLSPTCTTTTEDGECAQRMHNKDKEGSHDLDAPGYWWCLATYLQNM